MPARCFNNFLYIGISLLMTTTWALRTHTTVLEITINIKLKYSILKREFLQNAHFSWCLCVFWVCIYLRNGMCSSTLIIITLLEEFPRTKAQSTNTFFVCYCSLLGWCNNIFILLFYDCDDDDITVLLWWWWLVNFVVVMWWDHSRRSKSKKKICCITTNSHVCSFVHGPHWLL